MSKLAVFFAEGYDIIGFVSGLAGRSTGLPEEKTARFEAGTGKGPGRRLEHERSSGT